MPTAETPAGETETSGGSDAQDTSPTPDKDVSVPTQDPPGSTGSTAASVSKTGVAGHCLYMGADKRVIRCYWKREDCDYQISFNQGQGNTEAQECKAMPELHCMKPGDGGELCYPTATDCDKTVGNMRKRGRKASDCTAKTQP
jgi:hypothetical protein